MNKYISHKLKVVSFFCIFLVILIHSYYIEGEQYASTMFLMMLFGRGISLIAVPMFYVISGYLFFFSIGEDPIKNIISKQKKRISTLLVPYVLANLISVLFYFLLGILANKYSFIKDSVNINLLDRAEGGLWNKIYYCFWNGPIAFHMWFVRDLMVLVLISPLIYYFIDLFKKRIWTTILACLLLVLIIYIHYNSFIWSFAWFTIGGLIALNKNIDLYRTRGMKWLGLFSLCITMIFIVTNAFHMVFRGSLLFKEDLIPIFGVPALWILYDHLVNYRDVCTNKTWKIVLSSTFFIYITHEPFLNIFKKIPLLIDRSPLYISFCYMLAPIMFTIISILARQVISKRLPLIYKIYTGDR